MKKIWYNWSKPKKIISIICICLCSVFLVGCVGAIFANIDGEDLGSSDVGDKISGALGFSRTRNDQNVLDPDYYTDLIEGRHNGVEVIVNDDGSITLNGIAKEETMLELYTVKDEDCYGFTYTVGAVDFGKTADDSDLYWQYDCLNGKYTYDIPSGSIKTFTLVGNESSSFTFYIRLAKGDSFGNVTIYPTLNYGYLVQPYYEETSFFNGVFGSNKDRNSENMLHPYVYEDLDGKHSGVKVTVNNDGSITLDGEATSDIALTLGSFIDTDIAGQKMAVGRVDFGEDAPGSYLKWDYDGEAYESDSVYKIPVGFDFFFSPFFTSGSAGNGSEFHLNIVIAAGDSFDNVTIYPVLNSGVTVVPYFD